MYDGWKGSRSGRKKMYGAFAIPAKVQISSRPGGGLGRLVGEPKGARGAGRKPRAVASESTREDPTRGWYDAEVVN